MAVRGQNETRALVRGQRFSLSSMAAGTPTTPQIPQATAVSLGPHLMVSFTESIYVVILSRLLVKVETGQDIQ